jgi:hypothetical protein
MTSTQQIVQIREAVGVFGDAASLEEAVDELLDCGFEPAALSLLASTEAVEEKLGHKYQKVAELEDDPAAPRASYVSPETIDDAQRAVIGSLGMLGALGASGAVVASGGALAAAVIAAGLGAGTWGLLGELLAKLIGAHHASYIDEQLAHGGLLLWVRCADAEREESAARILRKHSGKDVHVHALPAA